ncbi:MAG: hypothetical protein SFV22_10560 [Saprospiraceae bacterium]|nr:hypothetical protein [Saprospiraceae bacterium]
MKNVRSFFPLFFIFCTFCKKDSTSNVEQVLVNGAWTQTAYLTDDDGDGVFTDASLPCQLGDAWDFMSNGNFEMRDEIEYCDPDAMSVSIIAGTWELRNGDSELFVTMDPSFQDFNFVVHSINDTLLELRLYNDPTLQAPPEERLVFTR